MRDHNDLLNMNERSLEQQAAVRRATFSPGEIKTLRPFSIWEISHFMFDVPADTLRKKLADDPTLPQGLTEEDGRQRWFSLEEIKRTAFVAPNSVAANCLPNALAAAPCA